MGGAAEGLDRRKEDVGVWLPLLAHVEAQSGVGPDPSEGVPGLLQDLLAVRSEVAGGVFHLRAVVSCAPRDQVPSDGPHS